MRDDDRAAVAAFLEERVETCVFLLSGLRDFGPRLGDSPLSGNFRVAEERGRIVGVFCLTRKGDLLAETSGRADLADTVLHGCADEPVRITGVIAEWTVAQALWRGITARPGFVPVYESESLVYRRSVADETVAAVPGLHARRLVPDDFSVWDPIDRAFHRDEGLEVLPDEDRRRRAFDSRASAGNWLGVFDGEQLVGTACMNASYAGTGQVGGVYTHPYYRRRGVARYAMHALVDEHRRHRDLRLVVLFAAARNRPARALYESLGFEACGRFGLLFGK